MRQDNLPEHATYNTCKKHLDHSGLLWNEKPLELKGCKVNGVGGGRESNRSSQINREIDLMYWRCEGCRWMCVDPGDLIGLHHLPNQNQNKGGKSSTSSEQNGARFLWRTERKGRKERR